MTSELNASSATAAESQQPLIAFLRTALELSFAMLETDRLTSGRFRSTPEAVSQALRIICSLEGRVEDPRSRVAIHNKTIDLEFALDALLAETSAFARGRSKRCGDVMDYAMKGLSEKYREKY